MPSIIGPSGIPPLLLPYTPRRERRWSGRRVGRGGGGGGGRNEEDKEEKKREEEEQEEKQRRGRGEGKKGGEEMQCTH